MNKLIACCGLDCEGCDAWRGSIGLWALRKTAVSRLIKSGKRPGNASKWSWKHVYH